MREGPRPVLCFGAKVLHFGGDCSIVGRRSGVSCSPPQGIPWSRRVSDRQMQGQGAAGDPGKLSNQHTMSGASVWQSVVESSGKERDRNIASSARCRSTVTQSQFHFMRGLKCKKSFPPVLKSEVFRVLFALTPETL